MADKLRKLYPLPAIFGPGEQPTAAKLSGMSTQTNGAFTIVERALGDLWNQGGDPVLSPSTDTDKYALHIPTIGRALGRMSYLNSMMGDFGSGTGMYYVDSIGNGYAGNTVGYLKYKPSNVPSAGNMIFGGTYAPIVQGNFKTDPSLIVATGDWHINTAGKIYTYDPIPFGATITYIPDVIGDIKTDDNTRNVPAWNVIPDPTTWTGAYTGIKISFANGVDNSTGYHIWLPPRKPLDVNKTLNMTPNQSGNIQSNPDSGTLLMWQNTGSNASLTNGSHYRYRFPVETTGLAAGTLLPAGFVYIWDQLFGTIVEGTAFFTPANTAHSTFKLRVTGADLVNTFGATVGNGIITADSSQAPGDYIDRFKVITIGASLAKVLFSLARDFHNHSHKTVEGGKPVAHSDLQGLVTPTGGANYPVALANAPFGFSRWTNDDHTQYLHRGGSTGVPYPLGVGPGLSASGERDIWDNAMFNSFIIAEPVISGRYLTMSADEGFAAIYPDAGGYLQVSDYSGTAKLVMNSLTGNGELSASGTHVVKLIQNMASHLYFTHIGDLGAATVLSNKFLCYVRPTNPIDALYDYPGYYFHDHTNAIGQLGDVYGRAFMVDGQPAAQATGGFRYYSAQEQFYNITPMDFNASYVAVGSGANTALAVEGITAGNKPCIYNPATSVTQIAPLVLRTQLRLPHGATILNFSTHLILFWEWAGPTSGVITDVGRLSLGSVAVGTDIFPSTAQLFLQTSTYGSSHGNVIIDKAHDTATVVINNATHYYYIELTLPAWSTGVGAIGYTKFLGARLNYWMSRVNN